MNEREQELYDKHLEEYLVGIVLYEIKVLNYWRF